MRTLESVSRSTTTFATLTLACLALQTGGNALAQGCIAVRGGACALGGMDSEHALQAGDWQFATSYRYLHSFRHFAGDVENTARLVVGNEVINNSHFIDASVGYTFNSRLSTTLVLPFVVSDRSSYYEHSGGNPSTGATRYHTQASGLADMRLGAYAWIWDPAKMPAGNIQIGLGLKAPTGDYEATDTFYTTKGPKTFAVDQSIQPGDGGWGLTAELFAWRQIHGNTSGYLQGFYLFNPEDVNGVSTETGLIRPKSITAIRNSAAANNPTGIANLAAATALGYNNINALEDVMSISDQYMARGGFSHVLFPSWGFTLSLGARIEGVPVEDALGDSNGFRRPGYTVSIEPGISMKKGRFTAGIFTPVAMYRNRQASVADERYGQITKLGTSPGDAAFADFVITVSLGYRF